MSDIWLWTWKGKRSFCKPTNVVTVEFICRRVGGRMLTQLLPSPVCTTVQHRTALSRQLSNVQYGNLVLLKKKKEAFVMFKALKESTICISGCRAWSSFKPDDGNIGSHSAATQWTQRTTIQDTQKKHTYRPSVCSSPVCWWGSRRPLLLLYRHCVPFSEPPRHFGFLYHWVGWLCSNQWGFPTTGTGDFFP